MGIERQKAERTIKACPTVGKVLQDAYKTLDCGYKATPPCVDWFFYLDRNHGWELYNDPETAFLVNRAINPYIGVGPKRSFLYPVMEIAQHIGARIEEGAHLEDVSLSLYQALGEALLKGRYAVDKNSKKSEGHAQTARMIFALAENTVTQPELVLASASSGYTYERWQALEKIALSAQLL